MIEALVMLALAGLVLSLLLPEIGRSVGVDTARAVASQDVGRLRRAEAQFRDAVRAAAPDPSAALEAPVISGDATTLRLSPMPRVGETSGALTFRIERQSDSAALILERRARREILADWPIGNAAFAYFSDGQWRSAPGPARVERVRLSIDDQAVWIESVARSPVVRSEAAARRVDGGGNLDR